MACSNLSSRSDEAKLVLRANRESIDTLFLVIVLFNILWIGIEMERPEGNQPFYDGVNQLFTSLFALEICYILLVEETWAQLCSKLNIFTIIMDLLIILEYWLIPFIQYVQGSQGESANLKIFALLRVIRCCNCTRLQKIEEIGILMRNIVTSIRTAVIAVSVLIGVTYVFSLLFTMACQDSPDPNIRDQLGTVASAMYTLWVTGCLGDGYQDTFYMLYESKGHEHLAFLFQLFVIIALLIILNIMLGIHVDALVAACGRSKEEKINAKCVEGLLKLVNSLDYNQDSKLQYAECILVDKLPNKSAIFRSLNMDEQNFQIFSQIFFKNNVKHANFNEFVDRLQRFNNEQASDLHLEMLGVNLNSDLRKLNHTFTHLQKTIKARNWKMRDPSLIKKLYSHRICEDSEAKSDSSEGSFHDETVRAPFATRFLKLAALKRFWKK